MLSTISVLVRLALKQQQSKSLISHRHKGRGESVHLEHLLVFLSASRPLTDIREVYWNIMEFKEYLYSLDPTNRIHNSSVLVLVRQICVQWISGTERAIIDPPVSKRPEKILSMNKIDNNNNKKIKKNI